VDESTAKKTRVGRPGDKSRQNVVRVHRRVQRERESETSAKRARE